MYLRTMGHDMHDVLNECPKAHVGVLVEKKVSVWSGISKALNQIVSIKIKILSNEDTKEI